MSSDKVMSFNSLPPSASRLNRRGQATARLIPIVALVGAIVLSLSVAPTGNASGGNAPAITPPATERNGKIAFTSFRDGNAEIYSMYEDNSGRTNLTKNEADDQEPSYSSDGTHIAFVSDRDGNSEIYVMNQDGTGQTRLTDDPASDTQPAFSPDGARLAFVSDRSGSPEIYVMNADGSGQTRLTVGGLDNHWPCFSPNGSRIAFNRFSNPNTEIYVMNADGTGQTRLTSNSGYDYQPTFSPDGTRIAFVSERDFEVGLEIFVMNVDGSGQTALTNIDGDARHPTFSPDGSRIAFVNDSGSVSKIYMMNADGSGLYSLTDWQTYDVDLSWGGTSGLPMPTLGSYPDSSVQLSSNTTVAPDAVPTNTESVTALAPTDFKGNLEADPTTGVVRVTNAHPAGVYTVTVYAFGVNGQTGSITTTFRLTVTAAPTCGPVSPGGTTAYNIGSTMTDVVVGDFNRDGRQDLAATREIGSSAFILLGDGAGGFSGPTSFFVGGIRPWAMVVGDFDGDGKQDIATAIRYTHMVSVMPGNGDGSFGRPTSYETGGYGPFDLVAGDFNGDGRRDIAVADVNSGTLAILIHNIGSGFRPPVVLGDVDSLPIFLTVGDFNGDGKQDLAAVDYWGYRIRVLPGDGTGGFGIPLDLDIGGLRPFSLTAGDANGDGHQDIILSVSSDASGPVLLGDGAGGFSAPVDVSFGRDDYRSGVGDFNGDGRQDFASITSHDVSVSLGDCAPTPTPPFQINIDPGAYAGRYFLNLDGANWTQFQGPQTLTLNPGSYGFDNGAFVGGRDGGSEMGFTVDASGQVTPVGNAAAAYATGSTLHLGNTTLNVDPRQYGGVYNLSAYSTVAEGVTGPHTFTLIPGMLFRLDNNNGDYELHFALDADGNVSRVNIPEAATGVGHTLTLSNADLVIDPRAFTNPYGLSSYLPRSLTGLQQLVVVPGLKDRFDNGTGNFELAFRLSGGQVELLSAPGAAAADGKRIVLSNVFVHIDPTTYTGSYRVGGVAYAGTNCIVLVGHLRTQVDDFNSGVYITPTAAGVTPSTAVLTIGGQPQTFHFDADVEAPITSTSLSATPNGAGWNNTDVKVTLSADDGCAGVLDITYSAGGAQTVAQKTVNGASAALMITAEGVTTISYFARDRAGNVEEARTLAVKIDRTNPQLTAAAQTNSGPYSAGSWTNRDVTVSFGCTDAGSGVAGVTAPVTLSGEGTGQSVAGTCTDAAGNTAYTTFGDIRIDKSAPTITVTHPDNNGTYALHQAVTASYGCADSASGVVACTGPVASGANIDTTTVGAKSFTVTARDAAGNEAAPKTVTYLVGYGVLPLFDQAKAHKSGSTIPVKLQVTDVAGANLSAPSLVVQATGVYLISTGASGTLADAGNANPDYNFRYDPSLGGYVFNLKTTGYATGTYAMTFMVSGDPAVHTVQFQVRQ